MKRFGLQILLVLGFVFFALPAEARKEKKDEAPKASVYHYLNIFSETFKRAKTDYVEEVPDQKLIEYAINGMLSSLDPHSSYLNEEMFKEMQEQTKGEFGGLGIEVTMDNGWIKVISPIDDTPAYKAGIKAGDYITHIDGTAVLGQTLTEAVDKMRGPVKTKVKLTAPLLKSVPSVPKTKAMSAISVFLRSAKRRRTTLKKPLKKPKKNIKTI